MHKIPNLDTSVYHQVVGQAISSNVKLRVCKSAIPTADSRRMGVAPSLGLHKVMHTRANQFGILGVAIDGVPQIVLSR